MTGGEGRPHRDRKMNMGTMTLPPSLCGRAVRGRGGVGGRGDFELRGELVEQVGP